MRKHQAHGFCRPGAGGNHVHRRRPGTQQIPVGLIHQILVVGIAVDRGHQALANRKGLVEHGHHGRQAVGGTGGVGDNLVVAAQQ